MTPLVAVLFGIYAALVAAVVAGLSTIWARITSLSNDQGVLQGELRGIRAQLEQVNTNISRLDGEIGRLNGEIGRLDAKIDNRFDQVDGKIDTLREEIQRNTETLREEIRRNSDRIVMALINHTHGDGTPPAFAVPPEIEPTAAND